MLEDKINGYNAALESQKKAEASVVDTATKAAELADAVVAIRDAKTNEHLLKTWVLREALSNPAAKVKIVIQMSDVSDIVSAANSDGRTKYAQHKDLPTDGTLELSVSTGEIQRAFDVKGSALTISLLSLLEEINQIKSSDFAGVIQSLRSQNFTGHYPISLVADLGLDKKKEEAAQEEKASTDAKPDTAKKEKTPAA